MNRLGKILTLGLAKNRARQLAVRRCFNRSIQSATNPRPVYEYVPKLMLGPGVEMKGEWQADIATGRCEPR